VGKREIVVDFARRNKTNLALLALLALFAVVVFPSFGMPFINRDEPLYAWQSLAIYHNPEMLFSPEINYWYFFALVPALASPLNAFFEPVVSVRIVSFLFSLVALFFTYLIGKKLFSETAGLAAMAFLMLSPKFFFFASKAMPGIPLVALAAIAIYLLFSLNKKRAVLLSLIVLAMYAIKSASLVVLPPIVVFLLLKYRKGLSLKHAAIAIVLLVFVIAAGVLLSPYRWWSMLEFEPGWLWPFLTMTADLFWSVTGVAISFFALLAVARFGKKIPFNAKLLLTWFFLAILPFLATRHFVNRHYLLAIPPIAVIAGFGFANLVRERNRFLLSTSIAIVAALCITSVLCAADLQTFDPRAIHSNEGGNLEDWIGRNLSKEDRLVILSEEFIMREIRLVAEKALQNPRHQMVVNPSRVEFEELVSGSGTVNYLVVENASQNRGLWLYSQDENWLPYIEGLGFEKEAEFRREGFGLLETFSVYKKPNP